MSIPAQSAVWDHRRNSSQTRPGTGTAKEALASMAAFRAREPAHAAWIAAGAPPITSDEEHARWFGCSYETARKKAA